MPRYHLPRMILLTSFASPNHCTCGHHRTTTAYHVDHKILWKNSPLHAEHTDRSTENSFVENCVEIGDVVHIGLSDKYHDEKWHLGAFEPAMHTVDHNRPAIVDCGDVIVKHLLSKKVNENCVGIKMLLNHCRKMRSKRETPLKRQQSHMDCMNKYVQQTIVDILEDATESESLEHWVDAFVGEALIAIGSAYHESKTYQVAIDEIVHEADLDQFAQTLVLETISVIQFKYGHSPNTTGFTESHDENDTEVHNATYSDQRLLIKDLTNSGHLNEECVSNFVDDILEDIANELVGVGSFAELKFDSEFEDWEFVEWKGETREYQYVGAYVIEVEHESDTDTTEWG